MILMSYGSQSKITFLNFHFLLVNIKLPGTLLELTRNSEATQTFQIAFKSMEAAVVGVIKFLGMTVCEGTDRVNVTEKVHNLLLCGMFMGAELVLVCVSVGFNQEYGCVS
jgi:hypothetical protein